MKRGIQKENQNLPESDLRSFRGTELSIQALNITIYTKICLYSGSER